MRDFDDPVLYEPAGMKPQCTYIVHWHSCRLDAGHSGKHSPGRIEEAAPRAEGPDAIRTAIEAIDHPCHDVCIGNTHAYCQCAAWVRQEALAIIDRSHPSDEPDA